MTQKTLRGMRTNIKHDFSTNVVGQKTGGKEMIAFLNWLDGVLLGAAPDRADDCHRTLFYRSVWIFPVPPFWLDHETDCRTDVCEG